MLCCEYSSLKGGVNTVVGKIVKRLLRSPNENNGALGQSDRTRIVPVEVMRGVNSKMYFVYSVLLRCI